MQKLTQSEQKKLTKIQSIFVRESVERLDFAAVVARWARFAELAEAHKDGKPEEALQRVLAILVPAQSVALVQCFSDYNNIRAKVQDHCLLEFWTSLVLLYSQTECGSDRGAASAAPFLAAALGCLVQNTFYISLIVIKAVKNGLIAADRTAMESHVKSLQHFNYETGIPLIKTLKANNELIVYNLRRASEALSRRLYALVERLVDSRATSDCEVLLEQSNAEFATLFKKGEPLFPAHLRPRGTRETNDRTVSQAVRAESASTSRTTESKPSSQCAAASPLSAARPPFSDTRVNEVLRAGPLPQVCESPALRESFPRKCSRKYTLVLDLDETLIHFKNDAVKPKFLIRPNAYNLLKALSRHYELIIFTAAQKEYADWILDKLDSKNNIVYRLYREHCQMSKTSHLKDLNVLGRDISKTIIVDNFAENFTLHKENGICIRSWYGDLADTALFLLEKFMLSMAEANPPDVRKYMKAHIENNPEKGFFLVY